MELRLTTKTRKQSRSGATPYIIFKAYIFVYQFSALLDNHFARGRDSFFKKVEHTAVIDWSGFFGEGSIFREKDICPIGTRNLVFLR